MKVEVYVIWAPVIFMLPAISTISMLSTQSSVLFELCFQALQQELKYRMNGVQGSDRVSPIERNQTWIWRWRRWRTRRICGRAGSHIYVVSQPSRLSLSVSSVAGLLHRTKLSFHDYSVAGIFFTEPRKS